MKNLLLVTIMVLTATSVFAADINVFAGKGLNNIIFKDFEDDDALKAKLQKSGYTISGSDWRSKNLITAQKGDIIVLYLSSEFRGQVFGPMPRGWRPTPGPTPKALIDKASNTIINLSNNYNNYPKYSYNNECKKLWDLTINHGFEIEIWDGIYNSGMPDNPSKAKKQILTKFDLL